jgi:hypothetical protein
VTSPERDDAALAVFQAALLEALDTSPTPEAAIAALLHREDLAAFHAYVSTFEPRTVAVAMDLVKKWGKRRP